MELDLVSCIVADQFPERFFDEFLYGLVALHDEAESGELTAAVADHLVLLEAIRTNALQMECLKAGECGS